MLCKEVEMRHCRPHLLHESARPVTGLASILNRSLPRRLPVAAAARSGGSGLLRIAGVDRGPLSINRVSWGVLSIAGASAAAVACGCSSPPLCCLLGLRSLWRGALLSVCSQADKGLMAPRLQFVLLFLLSCCSLCSFLMRSVSDVAWARPAPNGADLGGQEMKRW